jgi:hypothetical protein
MKRRLSKRLFWIERHKLGPRVHVLGHRVHEYQCGFALLAASPVTLLESSPHIWALVIAALAGLWLVVKDWPDLFPATRDKASWRLGVHRVPRDADEERP